jgi:hypothetical protein
MKPTIFSLAQAKRPFAVIQFFSYSAFESGRKWVEHELLYYTDTGLFISQPMTRDEIRAIDTIKGLELVKSNPDGKAWEFNRFKRRLKDLGIKHR